MAEHPPHIGNFPALIKRREQVFFANILAIIGLVVVIVVAIMGVAHLGTLSSPWFGSFFSKLGSSSSGLSITAPSDVISNKPFTLSWKSTSTDKGMYAIQYPCELGIGVDARFASSTQPIPCGAAYTLGTSQAQATFVPHLFATSSVTVPLTLIFIPSATGTQIQGIAKVAFHPDANVKVSAGLPPMNVPTSTPVEQPKQVTPPAPVPSETKTPVHVVSNGAPDLVVRIVAVGVIDPATNSLVPRAPISPEETTAVQFDVANAGTAPTGPWRFTAHLPTRDGYAYYSPEQQSLAPGGHIINTLQFTQTAPGLSIFSVMVNPDGLVHESNLNNNAATINISARY